MIIYDFEPVNEADPNGILLSLVVQPNSGFPDPNDFRNYGSVQQSRKECYLFSMSWLRSSPPTLNKVLKHGTVYHLVCLVMSDRLLLPPLWS
jgi:hypothetical protein